MSLWQVLLHFHLFYGPLFMNKTSEISTYMPIRRRDISVCQHLLYVHVVKQKREIDIIDLNCVLDNSRKLWGKY